MKRGFQKAPNHIIINKTIKSFRLVEKSLVAICIICVLTGTASAEIWWRTFGGNSNDDDAFSVQQTSDGGYIIVGDTISFGAGSNDVYLIKTDSNGNEVWSKTFGGSGVDSAHSIQQTTDGGYIIVGDTISFGAGSNDVYLIKTDSNGNELWSKTFGEASYDYARSVQQTNDGGYIIAGDTSEEGVYGEKSALLLIKTDADGNELWSMSFGQWAWVWSVHQTYDDGYIVAGGVAGEVALFYYKPEDGVTQCSNIAGSWSGSWSETYCDGNNYSGTWTGQVYSDCDAIAIGTTVTGTINPSTKVFTGTGTSEDCGSITLKGTFTDNFVSGSYNFSKGEGGSFTGSLQSKIPEDDSDGDGVPDGEEQGPSGNELDYDGNGDNIADNQQANVTSLQTYDKQYYVTLESPAGTTCDLNYDSRADFDSDGDIDDDYLAHFSQYYGKNVDSNYNIIVPQQIKCGDTITEDTVLTENLLNCPGNGLRVNPGVELDCNGHKITGAEGNTGTGVIAKGNKDIKVGSTVKNCEISGFGYFQGGIMVGWYGLAENNTVSNNNGYGIWLASWATARNNTSKNNNYGIGNDEGSYHVIDNNKIFDNTKKGIYLSGHAGMQILNNELRGNKEYAMWLLATRNSTISNNLISDSETGIFLRSYFAGWQPNCSPFRCANNNGICMANKNIFKNNNIQDVDYPLVIKGSQCHHSVRCGKESPGCSEITDEFCDYNECYDNDIDTSNTVNNKPMYYLYQKSNEVYENLDAGYFACIECDNVTIKNVTTQPNYSGFFIYKGNNVELDNVTAINSKYGLHIVHSTSTSIINSTLENNTDFDIYNFDQEQYSCVNTTCGLGMCYDEKQKVCPCDKKSNYPYDNASSACPDLDGDSDVDNNDETLFNQARGSECDDNFDSRADFNSSGYVDGTDLNTFSADFGRTDCLGSPDPCEGDFDSDGDVDSADLAIFTKSFGKSCHHNFNPMADLDGDKDVDSMDQKRLTAYLGEQVDCNFDPGPNPVLGCTDPTAENYNANATKDDGTCTYPSPGSGGGGGGG
jgi:parallel beta-helix repeat protein